jgi:hypothetical protein
MRRTIRICWIDSACVKSLPRTLLSKALSSSWALSHSAINRAATGGGNLGEGNAAIIISRELRTGKIGHNAGNLRPFIGGA